MNSKDSQIKWVEKYWKELQENLIGKFIDPFLKITYCLYKAGSVTFPA